MSNISDSDFISTVVGKCQNTKINKFIEDINKRTFQRDIVLLLIDIAEKPEISIDYNISISYYLTLYLRCREDPILSEAGCLILNAAKIYARRIDQIHDCVQNTLAIFENVSDKSKNNQLHNESENIIEKPKRVNKRTLPQQDYLQEYDLCAKKFKLSTDDKLFEKDIPFGCFEPPKRYCTHVIQYKEWRTSTKKKINRNINENFIDPELWKYSTIEDFDYEDDIDTKRNYQIFTNTIEHRYSTLKSDINFVMHFKVSDFVEAEVEHLNDDSTNEIPSVCKNSQNLSDNIRNYIKLENTILENELRDCDNNCSNLNCLDFRHTRRKRNTDHINLSENSQILDSTTLNESCTADTTINCSKNITNDDTTVPDTLLNSNITNLTNQDSLPVNSLEDDTISSCNTLENDLSNSENIDPKTIIVRLSMDDEGVFLSDLDEIDRAMLNPRVVATDILRSMENDISSLPKLKVTIDETFEKFFGIDESDKNLKETLSLNNQKPVEIKLNILKIPEKMLRKKMLFNLNSDYDLHKRSRKRKRTVVENPPRTIKLFKLNDLITSEDNSSQSPQHEPEFCGFTEEEMTCSKIINKNIDEFRKSTDKFRSISLDSGIAIVENLSNKVPSNNNSNQNEINDNTANTSNNEDINNLQRNLNTNLLSSTLIANEVEAPNFIDSGLDSRILENDTFTEPNDHEDDLLENHTQINDMIQKIQQWHRHLKPILAQSKDRHHFDVFEIGSEIINHFPKENSLQCNKTVNFTNVMENKDPSFISRYFLSMLLLANTNNIFINTINENQDQPCHTDNIQIELLNRKRHTVSVEDNIGCFNKRPNCSTQESVIFPKPIQNIRNNKNMSINDDNDSGFFSHTSITTMLG